MSATSSSSADRPARRLEPAVEIDRRDHRLHRIAEERRLAPPAGQHLRAPHAQRRAEADLRGDLGAGLLAHQRVQPRGELALLGLRILADQRLGDHQPQHPVAEELQPLVVRPPRHGGMRQRLQQQLGPQEIVAEAGRRLRHGLAELQSIPTKKRSGRQVQKASMELPAEEKITRSARPTRFSKGTVPTP